MFNLEDKTEKLSKQEKKKFNYKTRNIENSHEESISILLKEFKNIQERCIECLYDIERKKIEKGAKIIGNIPPLAYKETKSILRKYHKG